MRTKYLRNVSTKRSFEDSKGRENNIILKVKENKRRIASESCTLRYGTSASKTRLSCYLSNRHARMVIIPLSSFFSA